VVIGHREERWMTSLTYIAAYDGTDASLSAVRFTLALGRAQRAQVVATHVYPFVPPPEVPGPGGRRP
jgi:hypothetical protein